MPPNEVKLVAAVVIKHLKLDLLVLLKVVVANNRFLEVRVQVVLNCLSLPDEHPLIVAEFEQADLRVRFAECVEVFKFAAADVQLHFLSEGIHYLI